MMSDRELPLSERDSSIDEIRPVDDLLHCCPPDLRELLLKIKHGGRGAFRRATTQNVVNRALPALLAVYNLGASHADVAGLLHFLGIRTRKGDHLPIGTLSAAMHRAKMRAATQTHSRPPVPPQPHIPPPFEPTWSVGKGASSAMPGTPDVQAPPARPSGATIGDGPSARAPPVDRLDLLRTTNFLQMIRQNDD